MKTDRTTTRLGLALALLVALPTVAEAGCFYNGREVADGARIGERECRNGRWVDVGS